ncbi:unnamed protein product [Calypogeia fissa]
MAMAMAMHSECLIDRAVKCCEAHGSKPALTRCCSVSSHQLSSLTVGRIESCNEDKSTTRSPGREEGREEPTVAVGTGIYYQNLSPSLHSDGDISDLQNLFQLATVACEVESSTRHRQFVKKRRTPRKVLCINGSGSITNGKRIVPAAVAPVERQKSCGNPTAGHSTQPSRIGETVEDHTSGLTPKSTCTHIRHRSNAVILKFYSQHGAVGKKIMACPPKTALIEFTEVYKRNRVSSVLSKSRGRRMMPRKDTRVQGLAKRILQFVRDGSTAEKFIREAFGNNPDTSKALRLLLTQSKVHRVGDGGRGKAFVYVVTPTGLRALEELNDHDVITPYTDDNSAESHRPNHHRKVGAGRQVSYPTRRRLEWNLIVMEIYEQRSRIT